MGAGSFILFSGLASALIMLGRDEEALRWANKSVASNAFWASGPRVQACALVHLGRMEEARAVAARLMERGRAFGSATSGSTEAGPGLDHS